MSATNKAEQILSEYIESQGLSLMEYFDLLKTSCQSPIEEIFLAQLMADADRYMALLSFQFYTRKFTFPGERSSQFSSVDVHMQASVGNYYADFLFDDNRDGKRRIIVVECDGHDFHEKTKQQAAHDKRRDRYFVAQGIKVLRYTGSEIYNGCDDVMAEVFEHLSFGDYSS